MSGSVRLGKLCERVTVGHVGKMSDQYVEGDGVIFLRSQDVRPFRITSDSAKRVSPEFAKKLAKSELHAGDVVVVRTGYPGTAAVVPPELEGANCADLVVITPKPELNPHVLAAFFNSRFGQRLVGGRLVGSAQQHFNVTAAKELEVTLPPASDQAAIGRAIGDLCHLVESNRRRIAILEEIARLIYREWFVHFRFPGHEDVELVDSALGPIPEGWRVACSKDVGEETVGGDWGKDDPESDDCIRVACLRGTDLPLLGRGEAGEIRYRWVKDKSLDKRSLHPGDVVVEGSGECGRALAFVPELEQLLEAPPIYSNFCKRIRFDSEPLARFFARLYNEMVLTGEMNAYKTGTTIPNLNFKALVSSKLVPLPASHLLEAYAEVCRPMERFKLLGLNQVLSEARDLLLPRLVSGELDVSDPDFDLHLEPVT